MYDITYMWNLKKYNKLVNITKISRLKDITEQTSGYQWGERSRYWQYRGGGLRSTNY